MWNSILKQVAKRLFPRTPFESLSIAQLQRITSEATQIMNRTKGKKGDVIQFPSGGIHNVPVKQQFTPPGSRQVFEVLDDEAYKGLQSDTFRRLIANTDDEVKAFGKRIIENKQDVKFEKLTKDQRKGILNMVDDRIKMGNRKFMEKYDSKFPPEDMASGGRAGYAGGGWTDLIEDLHPFSITPGGISRLKRDIIDPFFKKKIKWDELDEYYRQLEMDKDMRDPENVPRRGERYAAEGGIARVGMFGGKLVTEGIKAALKRTHKAYDNPGAAFQVLMDNPSYLMSPVNMQKIKKLELYRKQLVRDLLRKKGGGKFTHGPQPKATTADLKLLDEYIAKLKNKISKEGYYGEGAAAEKALIEERPDLPFSKFVKDKSRHASGGIAGELHLNRQGYAGGKRSLPKQMSLFAKPKIGDALKKLSDAELKKQMRAMKKRWGVSTKANGGLAQVLGV